MTAYNPWPKARKGMKRSPIGAVKRQNLKTEESYYPSFEWLLNQHRLDFWHNSLTWKGTAGGWPDYCVMGDGFMAFVELKARNPETRRPGKVSPKQLRYKASIEAAGGDWRSYLLPDDGRAIEAW